MVSPPRKVKKKVNMKYMRYSVVLKRYNDANWISDTKDLKFINGFNYFFCQSSFFFQRIIYKYVFAIYSWLGYPK